jgi:signal transduction histidine kinase
VPKWSPVAASSFDARLQQLLDAMLSIGSDLSLPTVLRRIIESACKLVDARYGALGVLGDNEQLSQLVTYGVDQATHDAVDQLPEGKGILGLLVSDPRPLRLRDLTKHLESYGFPAGHPPMRSFLGVPVRGHDAVGSLYVGEKQAGDEFTADDERLVVALAAASAVAIDNVRLQERLENLAVLEDRDRIARELHDKIIQRLFTVGMTLQTTLPLVTHGVVADHITRAVDELDTTIRDLRNAIFALETQSQRGLRVDIFAHTDAARDALGFSPELRMDGPIDLVVSDEIAEQLLAALQEALSNVAQHADASKVEVVVESGSDVLLRVVDDGIGFPERVDHGRGLHNMKRRARGLGGTFVAQRGANGGTIVEWRVPLS